MARKPPKTPGRKPPEQRLTVLVWGPLDGCVCKAEPHVLIYIFRLFRDGKWVAEPFDDRLPSTPPNLPCRYMLYRRTAQYKMVFDGYLKP